MGLVERYLETSHKRAKKIEKIRWIVLYDEQMQRSSLMRAKRYRGVQEFIELSEMAMKVL